MYRRLLNSTISFFSYRIQSKRCYFFLWMIWFWFPSNSFHVNLRESRFNVNTGFTWFFSQTKFIMTICSGNSIRNVKKGQRLFVDRYHRYMERKMWFSNCQFRSNSLTGWNRKYIQMEIWSLQWEDFKLNWNNGLLHWIWGKVMKLVNREMIHNFLKSSEVKTFKSIDFDQFLIEV